MSSIASRFRHWFVKDGPSPEVAAGTERVRELSVRASTLLSESPDRTLVLAHAVDDTQRAFYKARARHRRKAQRRAAASNHCEQEDGSLGL